MQLLKILAIGLALTLSINANARDSAHASAHASGASMAAVSVAPASVVVVSAYVGGVMVVESVRAIGNVVEVAFKGAADSARAVVTVTAASAAAVSIGVGQTVKVVGEGTGYLIVASGKVLCFVPGANDQSFMRSSRSN